MYYISAMTKILIIEARFYDKISDFLLKGAKARLDEAEASYDVVTVPGALEIPAVIKYAKDKYDGFVALGCVIRGETYHFEIVSNESARGIIDLSIAYDLAIGNGILTVETEAQAIQRARKWDKGGFAANACLELVALKERLASKNLPITGA